MQELRRHQSFSILAIALVAIATTTTIISPPTACSSPKTDKLVSVWKFEQISHIEGPITLFIGNAGVKMICPIQHMICVAAPPKWEVTVFNEKEKLGMIFPSDQWAWRGFRLVDKVLNSEEKSRTATRWRGRPAEMVIRTVSTSDPMKEQVEMLYRESAGRAVEFKSEEFLYEKWLKLEQGPRNFLSGIYRVPNFGGLMLKRTRSYPNGRVDTALETLTCREVKIPVSEFVSPTNFKTAKSMNQLTEQKGKIKRAADMLEDMFLDKK